MTQIACNRQASKEACTEPGDYCFVVGEKEGDRMAGDDEAPTHIYLIDPKLNKARIPLQPEKPQGWRWNGDRDRPSLEPSILNKGVEQWHGWLGNGVLTDA